MGQGSCRAWADERSPSRYLVKTDEMIISYSLKHLLTVSRLLGKKSKTSVVERQKGTSVATSRIIRGELL